jgi:hypothetical protein
MRQSRFLQNKPQCGICKAVASIIGGYLCQADSAKNIQSTVFDWNQSKKTERL